MRDDLPHARALHARRRHRRLRPRPVHRLQGVHAGAARTTRSTSIPTRIPRRSATTARIASRAGSSPRASSSARSRRSSPATSTIRRARSRASWRASRSRCARPSRARARRCSTWAPIPPRSRRRCRRPSATYMWAQRPAAEVSLGATCSRRSATRRTTGGRHGAPRLRCPARRPAVGLEGRRLSLDEVDRRGLPPGRRARRPARWSDRRIAVLAAGARRPAPRARVPRAHHGAAGRGSEAAGSLLLPPDQGQPALVARHRRMDPHGLWRARHPVAGRRS